MRYFSKSGKNLTELSKYALEISKHALKKTIKNRCYSS